MTEAAGRGFLHPDTSALSTNACGETGGCHSRTRSFHPKRWFLMVHLSPGTTTGGNPTTTTCPTPEAGPRFQEQGLRPGIPTCLTSTLPTAPTCCRAGELKPGG